jgi:hypothetical protein
VVAAPPSVKPQVERESLPLKIIVRRVPPDRVSADPPTTNAVPSPPAGVTRAPVPNE